MLKKYKSIFLYLLLLVLSYWSIKPLLISGGYFPMHDDTQPARVYAMANELKNGVFPVRMVGTLGYGYGYPLFNFYAPLPYYIGALFLLFGLDLLVATKMMFVLGILLSGIFMLKLSKEIVGNLFGLVSAVFYIYAPYHAVNIYVRGAVGEYFAFAFLPLLVLSIYRIFLKKQNYLLPGIFGLSGVLLSHNIFGLITLYLLAFFWIIVLVASLVKKTSVNQLFYLTATIALGIGISAFFIIPAFFEKDFVKVISLNTGTNYFKDHYVIFSHLWDSPWGFGGSAKGLADGMSFKIGKIHVLSGLSALAYMLYLFSKKTLEIKKLFTFFPLVLIFILSIFMTVSYSEYIYELLPNFDYIQYPWRFLNLAVFSLSLLVGFLSITKVRVIKFILAFLLATGVIIVNAKYFDVKYIYLLNGKSYLTSENVFKASSISDEYLPLDLKSPQSVSQIKSLEVNSEYAVSDIKTNQTSLKLFNLEVKKPHEFVTNVAFFPGWVIKDNDKDISFMNNNGFISLDVNKGNHKVEMKFVDTPVRLVANTISFLSFILILYLAIVKKELWPKEIRLR